MKVLVACEFTGTVRDAFAAKGHNAWSCDLLPSERPGQHYQGDVGDMLDDDWDLLIAHPPCTYLAGSGARWKELGRSDKRENAAKMFLMLAHRKRIPKRVVENPVGCMSTLYRKPDQVVQPYMFGDDLSKKTCYWLYGLPLLLPTEAVPPRLVDGKLRWGNQNDIGNVEMIADYETRWRTRSATPPGIAKAMAEQWGSL